MDVATGQITSVRLSEYYSRVPGWVEGMLDDG